MKDCQLKTLSVVAVGVAVEGVSADGRLEGSGSQFGLGVAGTGGEILGEAICLWSVGGVDIEYVGWGLQAVGVELEGVSAGGRLEGAVYVFGLGGAGAGGVGEGICRWSLEGLLHRFGLGGVGSMRKWKKESANGRMEGSGSSPRARRSGQWGRRRNLPMGGWRGLGLVLGLGVVGSGGGGGICQWVDKGVWLSSLGWGARAVSEEESADGRK